MIKLSPDFYINHTLETGSIYTLSAPELIKTEVPHPFIIVAIDGDENYLLLCSTQKDRMQKHFDVNTLDYNGMIYIKPDSENKLKKHTFVNCNDPYHLNKNTLIEKLINEELVFNGKISENHYEQIKNGIINSHTNDIPGYLLIYSYD